MQPTNLNKYANVRFAIVCVFSVLIFSSCRTKGTVLAWSSAEKPEQFPEASLNLPKTGVCFSGGGTRAMNCAIGQMKGLQEFDLCMLTCVEVQSSIFQSTSTY